MKRGVTRFVILSLAVFAIVATAVSARDLLRLANKPAMSARIVPPDWQGPLPKTDKEWRQALLDYADGKSPPAPPQQPPPPPHTTKVEAAASGRQRNAYLGADFEKQMQYEKDQLFWSYVKDNEKFNLEMVEAFVRAGVDVNMRDSDGWPALYYAVVDEELFEAIAAKSLPLDTAVDGEFLHDAIVLGSYPHVIPHLIRLIVDVDVRDRDGGTPLSRALWDRDIVELLLAKGADVRATDDEGRNVLASFLQDPFKKHPRVAPGVAERLISLGMDPNMRDNGGLTLPMHAWQDTDLLAVLLTRGANIDAVSNAGYLNERKIVLGDDGFSVTFTEQDRSGVVVDSGGMFGTKRVKPRREDDELDGRIPNRSLDMSLHAGRYGGESLLWQLSGSGLGQGGEGARSALKLLIKRGANVNLPDVRGQTPLMRAVRNQYSFEGTPSAFDMLLDAGADVNATDDDGMTPLLCAAAADVPARQKLHAFRRLLEAGADPLARTPRGETPLLFFARSWNNVRVWGNDISRREHYDSENEREEERAATACVRLLLAAGLDVNDASESAKTPLLAAVEAGTHLAVVRELLDVGAKLSFLDDPATLFVLLEKRKTQQYRSFIDLDGLLLLLDAMPSVSSDEVTSSLLAWMQRGDFNAIYRTQKGVNAEYDTHVINAAPLPLSFLEKLLERDWTQAERDESLVAAARHGNKAAFELLLTQGGANIGVCGQAGDTILTAGLRRSTSENERAEWIRYCLDLGYDMGTRGKGGATVLTDEALGNLAPSTIRLLLDHGADVHARDDFGRTCLHVPRPGASVALLLEAGADGSAIDADGRSSLHHAVSEKRPAYENTTGPYGIPPPPVVVSRDAEVLSLLISADRAGINRQDASGCTPLFNWIMRGGDAEGVRLLLDAGADPALADADGRTPLHLIAPDDLTLLELLLATGRANVNAQDSNGRTPLFSWLERNGHPDGIRLLLDVGANPTIRDVNGSSVLRFVLAYSNLSEVAFSAGASYAPYVAEFLQYGADPNEIMLEGKTPLIFLLQQPMTRKVGRSSSVDLLSDFEKALFALADHGADFDFRDAYGFTAWDYVRDEGKRGRLGLLRVAARRSRPPAGSLTGLLSVVATCTDIAEIEALLSEGGADKVDAADSAGWTALAHAAWANPNPEVVRWLISHGADPNHRDNLGRTPLMCAAQAGSSSEVVKALIEGGARLELRDYTGNDALNIAIQRDASSDAIFQLYLAAQKLPGGEGIRGQILRAVCATTGDPKLVNALVRQGAPIDEPDANGQTPLMHAVSRNGNPDIVKALLEMRRMTSSDSSTIDVNAKDAAGLSVLDYAWKGNVQIYRMLVEAGADPYAESAWWHPSERRLMREEQRWDG